MVNYTSRDYDKIEDKFFKQSISGINRLLNKLGIPHTIVEILPQEFLSYKEETKIMDLGGLIDDEECAINLEFKSNYPSMEEIRNTLEYAFYLSSKTGKKVYSYIISTVNSKKTGYQIEWHNDDIYYIPLYTFKEFDAEETRSRIQTTLDNDGDILDEDLSDISVLTFMKSKKEPKELLIDSIKLINQINMNNSKGITIDDINSVKSLLILLTKKFTDTDEERAELIGMIKMEGGMLDSTIQILKEMGVNEQRDKLIREGEIEGIKKGKIEGKLEEKITTAKNLLKIGLPIKQISEVTKMDIEEIKTLKENNKSY